LCEVKADKGTLTPAQTASAVPFHIVRTADEAIAVFERQIRRFKE
jgi:hypothetical protein